MGALERAIEGSRRCKNLSIGMVTSRVTREASRVARNAIIVHPVNNLTAEGHSSGGHDSESVSAPRPPGRKDTTM